MTSIMIYIVTLGVGFECPRKIHLNTQWGGGVRPPDFGRIEDVAGQWRRTTLLYILVHPDFQTLCHPLQDLESKNNIKSLLSHIKDQIKCPQNVAFLHCCTLNFCYNKT